MNSAGTDPLDPDSDRDFLADGAEVAATTQPTVADSDGGALPALAVDALGVHVVWAGRDGPIQEPAGIQYALLNPSTGAVRIAATNLTPGRGSEVGYPSIGSTAGGRVKVVYQDRGAGAVETFVLSVDAARDNRDGSPANPAVIVVVPPSAVTADDGLFSCRPRARIAADGAVYLSYLEQTPGSSSSAELFFRAIDASGADLLPEQAVTTGAADFTELSQASPPGPLVPVVAVAWDQTGADGEFSLLRLVNPDDDGDGLANAEERALGTDPSVADTDGGGRSDGDEVNDGTDPLDPADDLP